jgi:hypothetical protein
LRSTRFWRQAWRWAGALAGVKERMITEKVGEISAEVAEILDLDIQPSTPILLGETNLHHMKYGEHREDFEMYGDKLSLILEKPDYVRFVEDNETIEYIKIFGRHVKVAVRVSRSGNLFVRSLYVVLKSRTEHYIKTGELKRLTKQ